MRSKKQRKNSDQFTDPDFDDLSSSEILGDAYQRKSRVRQPLELTKLQLCDGYPVGIYTSLKCSELQDCDESHSQLLAQLQVQDHIESCSESEDEEEHGKIEYDSQLGTHHRAVVSFEWLPHTALPLDMHHQGSHADRSSKSGSELVTVLPCFFDLNLFLLSTLKRSIAKL